MRLALVPNAELGDPVRDYEPILPLGLLSLTAALSSSKACAAIILDPRVVDFRTPAQTADIILECLPDAIGFSTMCNTYPHALRTAEILKQIKPNITIIFGGPHASVIGQETLNNFPWIDFVLQGECERSIEDFVQYLTCDGVEIQVPGLIARHNGVAIPPLPTYPILPPDQLPIINYAGFPRLEEFRSIPLDVGRGCPFACTFCTTNLYFERRYRLRDSAYVIETVKQLKSEHGLNSFSFVHDNFTASPRRVAEFCRDILDSGISFDWRCSARPDSVDSELIDLMHAAGCKSIFMGLESGSSRIQQLCLKKVRLERALPAVSKAFALGMGVTASFITGFPYEEVNDVEQTIRMMAAINYESRTRCDLQLHLLSPVPGAPLTAEPGISIALDDAISDVSAAADLDSHMQGWIREIGPPIFESFYHYLNPNILRSTTVCLRLGWFTMFNHLKLTAFALEEARQHDPFAFVTLFDKCELPDPTWTSIAIFDWCTRTVEAYLTHCGRPFAASIADVLHFEALAYRLRSEGGSSILKSDHDIYAWSEGIVESSGPPSLPSPMGCRYLIVADGGAVKVAYLSTEYCADAAE